MSEMTETSRIPVTTTEEERQTLYVCDLCHAHLTSDDLHSHAATHSPSANHRTESPNKAPSSTNVQPDFPTQENHTEETVEKSISVAKSTSELEEPEVAGSEIQIQIHERKVLTPTLTSDDIESQSDLLLSISHNPDKILKRPEFPACSNSANEDFTENYASSSSLEHVGGKSGGFLFEPEDEENSTATQPLRLFDDSSFDFSFLRTRKEATATPPADYHFKSEFVLPSSAPTLTLVHHMIPADNPGPHTIITEWEFNRTFTFSTPQCRDFKFNCHVFSFILFESTGKDLGVSNQN
jgi:hypothetical protein